MSLEDTDFGLGKGQLPVIRKTYIKLLEENPKLKREIKELKEEINFLNI